MDRTAATAEAGGARWQRAAAVAGAAVVALGVLVGGWPPLVVLALYWAENVAIGLCHVLRLVVAGARAGNAAGGLAIAAFFTVHYGIFTLVHGMFVVLLFSRELPGQSGFAAPYAVLADTLFADRMATLATVALAAGAVIDTWQWFGTAESRRIALPQLMSAPYGRVIVLHVVLIGGGFLVQALGAPVAAVLLLVALKLWLDLKPPQFSRKAARAPQRTEG